LFIHGCKVKTSHEHLNIKQEKIYLYYKFKPRIFATGPEVLGEDRDLQSIQLQRNMLATFNSMLVSSLEPLVSTFTDRQQEILNESGYSDLMRNSSQIINCAMLLSLGYIREATTYAESCGGGGSPGSGWGRDKDEDDDHWWRRCIAVSAAMMRPAKYRLRRGR